MKLMETGILILLLASFSSNIVLAQKKPGTSLKFRRNSINIHAGIIDYNINYERYLFLRPVSYTNIRIGIGKDESYLDGYYVMPALAHLIGRKNSHLELSLGCKILIGPLTADGSAFLPDLFVGYRYEKPSGKFMFKAGINLITVYNVGMGIKF